MANILGNWLLSKRRWQIWLWCLRFHILGFWINSWINWSKHDIPKLQSFASHPWVTITENYLVESWFFCHKSYFDHVIGGINNLYWKYFLHLIDWMLYCFFRFSFIENFKDTFWVSCPVKSKLDIISNCLKHYRNNTFWLINFHNVYKLFSSFYFINFREANLKVKLVVRNRVQKFCLFDSVILRSTKIYVVSSEIPFNKIEL